MILIFEKRFLAPLKIMLVSMRVVSNMNSKSDTSMPRSTERDALAATGWTNKVTPRRFISSNHGS